MVVRRRARECVNIKGQQEGTSWGDGTVLYPDGDEGSIF